MLCCLLLMITCKMASSFHKKTKHALAFISSAFATECILHVVFEYFFVFCLFISIFIGIVNHLIVIPWTIAIVF